MRYRFTQIVFLIKCLIRKIPERVFRFLSHPVLGYRKTQGHAILDFFFWIAEWPILLLDVFGVPEIIEIVQILLKWNIRSLTGKELELGREMIGESIDWNRVKIDDHAYIGPKQGKFAYVSFYLINFWGTLYPATFVHELIHIWQFEKFGSVYLLRALRAQHSKEKYDYGGLSNLKAHLEKGLRFSQLNYEQQGDVLSDYFLLKTGALRGRGRGQLEELEVYERLLKEIS